MACRYFVREATDGQLFPLGLSISLRRSMPAPQWRFHRLPRIPRASAPVPPATSAFSMTAISPPLAITPVEKTNSAFGIVDQSAGMSGLVMQTLAACAARAPAMKTAALRPQVPIHHRPTDPVA